MPLPVNEESFLARSKQIQMNFEMFNEASRLEADSPSRSLELYSALKRENKIFHFNPIIVAMLLPLLTFILALWISTSYGVNDLLVTLFVWVGIGYVPIYIISLRKYEKVRGYTVRERFRKLKESNLEYYFFTYFLIPIIGYFSAIVLYLFIVTITALFVAALHYAVVYIYHSLANMPFETIYENTFPFFATYVMGIVFFIVFFLFVSDVPIKDMFSLKKVLIGIKVNLKNILLVLRDMMILVILGGGSMGLFYAQPFYGVLTSIVAGLTSGLLNAWSEKDWVLGEILEVAKIRCLIYLGRITEAKYSLKLLMHLKGHPKEVDQMLQMIACVFEDSAGKVRHYSQDVLFGSDSQYQDIYSRNFQLTEKLLNYR